MRCVTPLHFAAMRSRVWALKALCDAGASVDSSSKAGKTAMHVLVAAGSGPACRGVAAVYR